MIISNNANFGSVWNKWDLHIHSPYTNMNGYSCNNDEFIQKIQNENLVCVGLTNYFKFKNEEFELKQQLETLGIRVLMNLEIRLDYVNKDDESLDLHIIFSEMATQIDIEKLLNNLKCNVSGNSKKLIDLSSKEDFKFAVVNFDKLLECLEDESLNLQGKYLVGFLSRGKGNARSSSNFEKIINKAHFLIHSTNSQNKINEDIEFWKQYKKPILQSSDAHSLETIGSKFSWIKSKPSFDGLKQIIYEIERVYIGEESPLNPLHKLEKVQLNFDENVRRISDEIDNIFCFANFNQPLYFSPYFTCIIGGRGSGKSTLLNLIANKIGKLDDENKKKLPIGSNNKTILTPNEVWNIEFLAQNEIENFVKDSAKFTQAIFERLDKNSSKELSKLANNISEKLQDFDEQIKLLIQRVSLHQKLQAKKKALKQRHTIIKFFNDEKYLQNKEKLQKVGKELWKLNSSKTRLKELFDSLKEINKYNGIVNLPQNIYDKVFNESLKNIKRLIQTIKDTDYQIEKNKITSLEHNKKEIEQQIHTHLQNKGLSENNIQDLQNAGEEIEILKNDINNIKLGINDIKQKIIDFKFDDIDMLIENFNNLIKGELKKINNLFNDLANNYRTDIKIIRVEYAQNDMFEKICDEFIEILKQFFQIDIREKVTFKSYVRELDLSDENLTFNRAKEKVNNFNKTTETSKIIKEIFNNKLFFNIYHLLVIKNLRDIENVKKFNIYYDDKILSNASFGQRCTAVIVILLSLGNNPIIMDEPEAHLDSSLIANYLVELIKQQKQHRQIIFATHNANFVLNADAELIIKLNNDGDKITAQSFSIEDSDYREDLLKLEGGKEAFKKRERKYEI